MSWRQAPRGLSIGGALAGLTAILLAGGCGGPAGGEKPASNANASANTNTGSSHPLIFVGFDASQPLINALKQGKIQGLVVQNPYRMGQLGVRTVVDALEKKPIAQKVSTGETLVTPENVNDPSIHDLLYPPQAENQSGAGSSAASADGKKTWRIMVIPKGTTHVFWKTIHAGALKAAEEIGHVEILWQGPQKEDERSQQIQLVQNAIATGVDGIVLAPLDSRALVKPVEEAIARGIPVVVIDSGLESKKIASYVATDNYHGGELAGRRMGELLNGQGKIIMLRYAIGSESTDERERGFIETLSREYPRIVYLSDSEYAGATSELAQQKSQNLLTRFRGQADGIYCPNESTTFGMLRALEGAGMLTAHP